MEFPLRKEIRRREDECRPIFFFIIFITATSLRFWKGNDEPFVRRDEEEFGGYHS